MSTAKAAPTRKNGKRAKVRKVAVAPGVDPALVQEYLDQPEPERTTEMPDVPLPPLPPPQPDAPPAYYDAARKRFYLVARNGEWIPVNDSALAVAFRIAGLSGEVRDACGLTAVDRAIHQVQMERHVAFAGPLAGYMPGIQETGGQKVLVTRGYAMIPAREGEWPTLAKLFSEQFTDPEHGEIQCDLFFGWLQSAVRALKFGSFQPGQVLALAGEAGTGKSLVQSLITRMLGGRVADPFRYLSQQTAFNSDLIGAEHLAIEDTASARDIRAREAFGQGLKGMIVNHTQSLHGKGRDAVTVRTFARVTISLNCDAHALMVIPPLDEGFGDKITILKVHRPDLPTAETPEEWTAWFDRLCGELPAFLHWLAGWSVPAALADRRYGVRAWHHPELAGELDDLHPFKRMLALLDRVRPWQEDGGPGGGVFDRPEGWEGTVEDLEEVARAKSRDLAERVFHSTLSAGQALRECARRFPARFTCRLLHGRRIWCIKGEAA